MGLTCLAAAFLFGRYIHNRPAQIEQATEVASGDPIDSFLSAGTAPTTQTLPAFVQQAQQAQQAQPELPPELTTRIASAPVVTVPQDRTPPALPQNKPVAPDFSELAARFRNSPLELNSNPETAPQAVPVSHLPDSRPPQMHFRQPERTVSIRRITNHREPAQPTAGSFTREEFATPVQQSEDTFSSKGRWRVSRPGQIDQFVGNQQNQRITIDDIYEQRSADYLRDGKPEPWRGSDTQSVTSVTEPPLPFDPPKAQFSDPARFTTPSNNSATTNSAPSFAELRRSLDRDDPRYRFSNDRPSTSGNYGTTDSWQTKSPPRPEPDVPDTPQQDFQTQQRTQTQTRSNFLQHQPQPRRRTYRVQPGDRLQTISTRFYGTPDHYIELYKANREALDGITNIPGGIEIVIPELE